MSSFLSMEFVQALNPLYAFPIVAVVLCVFVVYAFGFRSPVQPPSFDGIEEERKSSKKRKTKDSNKHGRVVQNGKLNGSTSNKAHLPPPGKKKEMEKIISADKSSMEKISHQKAAKKTKPQNEKKNILEKKESISVEDAGEDGWVQLISKKGRKNRKKEANSENQNFNKLVKNSEIHKSENSCPEELPVKTEVTIKDVVPEKKQVEDVKEAETVLVTENKYKHDKLVMEESKSDSSCLEKAPTRENTLRSGKLVEETINKSKKKKKKNSEIMNTDNSIVDMCEKPAVQGISEETSLQNATVDFPVTPEAPNIFSGKVEVNEPEELKSNVVVDELEGKVEVNEPKELKSNVVFDELEGLYPEVKEQRRKKKVRRDH